VFMLILNHPVEMDTEPIVIRIKTPLGDMDSSVDYPSVLNFNDLLVSQLIDITVSLHLYEDEVGDRITVRSDEELKAMLSYFVFVTFVFAHLQVNTRPSPANDCTQVVPDSLANNSLKKSSAELKTILTNGQVSRQKIYMLRNIALTANFQTVTKENFLAYHVLSKRVLAVKVIPLDITVELQKQIMSELEILYKCDSPYIITFFSAFFVENRISICTEFMDGGSLDVYKRIPEHVLGRIAVAVVKGLTYLWSLKILHRDVKPSNMLVNTRGQVKLCDFGVSTQLVNSIAKTYVGTNAYMAPERISGEQYGIHADVWSVGISFMELALGMFPYPQVIKYIFFFCPLLNCCFLYEWVCFLLQDPPVLPVGQFSEKFVHFITQCMRKNPKERPVPNNLLDHSFIIQYNDGNAEVVSMWVCRCLEERRSQQAQ
uniref:mitogen-activated protein kinase kinase n=1 Tax=Poecilia mexicana TaxID=48701 RepID=A0A3B3XCG8_9TELE